MNSLSFDEKSKIGENDNYICSLIRNDSVVDFISYINSTNLPLSYKIEKSFFETNSFLIDKQPSLIEYAAFFGSIQIFKYLHFNKMKVDESLFFYAIHGNNPEIIHIIEENFLGQMKTSFAQNLFNESIKCHQF